uniref:Uncharacterized protein n=1 Tax=Rhizophora mucronata TaxID=61149 RepID=A0A2P2PTC2_RHIMU
MAFYDGECQMDKARIANNSLLVRFNMENQKLV